MARGLDSNTMQLQYLETLKQVGSSPSTKLVVPMELGGLLNGLRNLLPPAGWQPDQAVAKRAVEAIEQTTPQNGAEA